MSVVEGNWRDGMKDGSWSLSLKSNKRWGSGAKWGLAPPAVCWSDPLGVSSVGLCWGVEGVLRGSRFRRRYPCRLVPASSSWNVFRSENSNTIIPSDPPHHQYHDPTGARVDSTGLSQAPPIPKFLPADAENTDAQLDKLETATPNSYPEARGTVPPLT